MRGRTWPRRDEFVVYAGRHLTLEFYYTQDARVPVSGFYRSRPEEERRRFLHIVEYLTDQPAGRLLPRAMFNLEDADEKIFAIKPYSSRYLGFFTTDKRFVICDAYLKQTQRLGRRERKHLATAINRKRDYLERTQGGVYYEKTQEE